MKKIQQSRVAMKIALSLMLGSALFLSACSDGGDTELRNVKYYDTLEKAKKQLDWCAKKLGVTLDYQKVEEIEKNSQKPRGSSFNEADIALSDPIVIEKNKQQAKKEKEKIDTINYRNCLYASEAYTKIIFKIPL